MFNNSTENISKIMNVNHVIQNKYNISKTLTRIKDLKKNINQYVFLIIFDNITCNSRQPGVQDSV